MKSHRKGLKELRSMIKRRGNAVELSPKVLALISYLER